MNRERVKHFLYRRQFLNSLSPLKGFMGNFYSSFHLPGLMSSELLNG